MTPRPFYRSRLFWFGVPGLVFLLWVWLFSNVWISLMAADDHRSFWLDSHYHAGLFEVHLSRRTGETRGESVMVWGMESLVTGDSRFHPALSWHEWNEESNGELEILEAKAAIWTLLVPYLLVWLWLTRWWQRRKSRLMKLHAAPPP